MFIGVQYYRPPFPDKRYWDKDLSLIRDTGIDAIQLWACWGWIEPEPGKFRFDDYDELVNKARKRGLKVIISTIAEIHPFWIHRAVPDSYMIDHMGNKVISSLRSECNVGLTPGGCFDNPKVLDLMAQFLKNIAKRYAGGKNIIGWDCWNETRWNVQSDGYVCYCPYTIDRFRKWLKKKYGNLEKLNNVWRRRYCSWDDVSPGKLPDRPYTEMMEFLRFLTWRAGRHMQFRYEQIRQYDKKHIISAHCGQPSIMSLGGEYEQTLCRGNDWEHCDQLDGFGSSHFPSWGEGFDEVGYGIRVESIRSAARNKIVWVSELQGGSARDGITAHRSVLPASQQLWVWNGIARGAKGVIFWCWRDEVFGRESSGFGLAGNDGLAKERLKALKTTCRFLKKHESFLDNYRPFPPKVGVLFEPDNYYLNWAQDGNSNQAGLSILGYLSALERLQIPYEVVESNHPEIFSKLKLLILPWPLIINKKIAKSLIEFVSKGGTIFCEGELNAYDSLGFYHYSGNERQFATFLGIKDMGRRIISQESINFNIGKKIFKLKPTGWFAPLDIDNATVLAKSKEKYIIAAEKKIGKGFVYTLGTFLGITYQEKRYKKFEDFIHHIVLRADALPDIRMVLKGEFSSLQWKSGLSGSNKLLFVINSGKTRTITFKDKKKIFFNIEGNSWKVLLLGEKPLDLLP